MKKVIILLGVVSLFYISCSTVNIQKQNQSEMKNDVSVNVLKVKRSLTRAFKGLVIQIQNIGNTPVVINWNKSSISYNNTVSNLFITGQMFRNAGTADVPPLTIPAGSKKEIEIYPSDNIEWKGNDWNIRSIRLNTGSEINLSISASIGDSEKIISVKAPVE